MIHRIAGKPAPPPEPGPILPQWALDYLASGAPEGERNDTLYRVAQQFHAVPVPQAEAESWLMPRATADGLTDREAMEVIASAYKSTKVTEPLGRGDTLDKGAMRAPGRHSKPGGGAAPPPFGPKVGERGAASGGDPQTRAQSRSTTGSTTKSSEHAKSTASSDGTWKHAVPAGADDFTLGLTAAFKEGEIIAISEAVWNGVKWVPGKPVMKTREEWMAHHKKVNISDFMRSAGGAYISINPLATKASRKAENIAEYRHVLAEWDKEFSIEEQREKLKASGYPISYIVSSAVNSAHGLIRVDAPDKRQWEERRDEIFAKLGCDQKNKDISRVSRCPGVMRETPSGPKMQAILDINVGPAVSPWASINSLPPMVGIEEMEAEVARGDGLPDIVLGLLSVRSKMMLSGPSKSRKSWTQLELAICISCGHEWLGFKTRQGPVVFIDGELHKEWIVSRCRAISESRGIDVTRWSKNLSLWPLRGKFVDAVTMMNLVMDQLKQKQPIAVFIDPIYKMLGDLDENKAGDINKLLSQFEKVCQEIGCAIIYTHHFAKGDSSDRSVLDRASGSGVFARDADTLIYFTPPPQPKTREEKKNHSPPGYDFDVECIVRGHSPVPAFRVKQAGAHFIRAEKVQKYKLGSGPEKFGAILAKMPEKIKTSSPDGTGKEDCDVAKWVAKACSVTLDEACSIFNTLRNKKYTFVEFVADGIWRGVDAIKNP